jgi:hypothetical protein
MSDTRLIRQHAEVRMAAVRRVDAERAFADLYLALRHANYPGQRRDTDPVRLSLRTFSLG